MSDFSGKFLVIRKETIFDKIRKNLNRLFFLEEEIMMEKLDVLEKKRTPKPKLSEIVIPKEIGKKNND